MRSCVNQSLVYYHYYYYYYYYYHHEGEKPRMKGMNREP
jgi:hypothetical protein